jgi:hypothetical protein
MKVDQRYYEALKLRFESKMKESEANLSLYLDVNRLVAIGEHSDLMEEQEKWLTIWVDAKDKLEGLEELKKIMKKDEQ